MALTISSVGSAADFSVAATLSTGATVTASVGDWLVVFVAASNSGTGGAASIASVVDGDGINTYTQRAIVNYDPGNTREGATLGIFTCEVTSALASDTVTVNFSPNETHKAVEVYRIQPSGAQSISFVAADTTGVTGLLSTYAASTVSVESGHVIFGAASIETDDTVTGDGDTTNGSWSTVSTILSDSGSDNAAQSLVTQYKIATAAGDQSWAATTVTARDSAISYIVLKEGYDLAADAASYGISAAAVSVEIGRKLVAAVATFAVTAAVVAVGRGLEITVAAAEFAVSAEALVIERGYEVAAGAAVYEFAAQSVSIERGYEIAVDALSYSCAAASAAIEYGRAIDCEPAAFAFSGSSVTFVYEPSTGLYIFSEAASFAVAASAIAVEYGRQIAVDADAEFGVLNEDASVEYGFQIAVEADGFGFSPGSVAFEYRRPPPPYNPPPPRKPGHWIAEKRFNEGGFRPLRK